MMTWLIIAAIALASPILIPFVLMYLIVPIRIRASQRPSAIAGYQETRIDQLTPEMQEFIGEGIHELTPLGFEVVANVAKPEAIPGLSAFQVLLVNRQTKDLASLLMVHGNRARSLVPAIGSHFADGTKMVTSASRNLGVFPRNPLNDSVNFSWARSPALLWEAHRRRLARSGRQNEPRIAPTAGEAIVYLEEQSRKEYEWAIRCGYKYYDQLAQQYPFTWRGAYVSTWKLAPPIKQWRLSRRDRKARRLWQELNMDNVHSTQPMGQGVANYPLPALPSEDAGATRVSFEQAAMPLPVPDDRLGYAAALGPGEIRKQVTRNSLTIRVGSPTTGQILVRKWPSLLMLLFWGSWIAAMAYAFRLSVGLYWRAGMAVPGVSRILLVGAIGVGVLALEIVQLVQALRNAVGTTVLTADRQGLRFTNAPGRIRHGHVTRDDIDLLNVRSHQVGIFSRSYRLALRKQGQLRAQTLLVGRKKADLEEVKQDLMKAMGLAIASAPAEPAAP